MNAHGSFARSGMTWQAHWHERTDAAAIISDLRPSDFVARMVPAVFGPDLREWYGLTDDACNARDDLAHIRMAHLADVTGFSNYADAYKAGEALSYLEAGQSLPTVSEALETHFARLDGRFPERRVRPSREESEAFKLIVGAGL